MPTTRQTQASVSAGGDLGGDDNFGSLDNLQYTAAACMQRSRVSIWVIDEKKKEKMKEKKKKKRKKRSCDVNLGWKATFEETEKGQLR